jgi:hypothetical protein
MQSLRDGVPGGSAVRASPGAGASEDPREIAGGGTLGFVGADGQRTSPHDASHVRARTNGARCRSGWRAGQADSRPRGTRARTPLRHSTASGRTVTRAIGRLPERAGDCDRGAHVYPPHRVRDGRPVRPHPRRDTAGAGRGGTAGDLSTGSGMLRRVARSRRPARGSTASCSPEHTGVREGRDRSHRDRLGRGSATIRPGSTRTRSGGRGRVPSLEGCGTSRKSSQPPGQPAAGFPEELLTTPHATCSTHRECTKRR